MQLDEYSSFLNFETGEVETVSDALLDAAEAGGEDPDLPAWQKQEWEMARQIVSARNRFHKLPTKFEVHEWAIMDDFARSIKSNGVREDLVRALHGAGAFRKFKDAVRRHDIEPTWFAFRAEALKQIAVEWCQENHIAWK